MNVLIICFLFSVNLFMVGDLGEVDISVDVNQDFEDPCKVEHLFLVKLLKEQQPNSTTTCLIVSKLDVSVF